MKTLISAFISIFSLLVASVAFAGAPEIKQLSPYQADMAKRGVFPFQKKGLWGFADINGKTLIKPMFDSATEIDRYGLSTVSFEGKQGLVGKNCRYVLEPCYDEIGPFDDHKLSYVKQGGKVGLITINGKVVVPAEFDSISSFHPEGFALVVRNGRQGTINYKGEIRVPVEFDKIRDFNDYCFLVTKDGKSGLIDHKGTVIVPVVYDEITLHGSKKFHITKKDGKYGVLTNGGAIHCDQSYDFIHPDCINDVILVRKDGKMGAVNGDFGYKIVIFFDELSWPEDCNEYLVTRDASTGLYGAVTLEGKKILDCVFTSAPVLGDKPMLYFVCGRYILADRNRAITLSQADDELYASCRTDIQAYLSDNSIPQSAKKHLPNVDVEVLDGEIIEYRTEWSDFNGLRIGGCGLWNATRNVWKLRPVYESQDGGYIKCGEWSVGTFKDGKASVGYKGKYQTIDESATIIQQ